MLVLRSSPTSPFGRKVKIAASELGLTDRIEVVMADTNDPSESLRQQMLALHDQASKRRMQAMVDASQVLTPEQRVKLAERMKQRGEMMRERMERRQGERTQQ